MGNNFNIEYDLLKDDFVIRAKGKEIGRIAKISVVIAINECLCNNGDVITLFEDYLPIAHIKREAINQDSETKIVTIKIKNNNHLTKEELDTKLKALTYDAIVALTREVGIYRKKEEKYFNYKKIVEIFAEMISILEISKKKSRTLKRLKNEKNKNN